MKILLTSYGLGWDVVGYNSLPERIDGVPPLSFKQSSSEYIPDFSVLLLCENLVMNETTFNMIIENRWGRFSESYSKAFQALKDEGFITLKKFYTEIRDNSDTLKRMLDRDLKHLDVWMSALKESCDIWRRFLERASKDDELIKEIHNYKAIRKPISGQDLLNVEKLELERVSEALKFPSRLRHAEYRAAVHREMEIYLTLVNANLLLAKEYDCSIYDWADHGPFYREKFLSIGADGVPGERNIQLVKKLFEIAFPELKVDNVKTLIRVLKDKRIVELRQLINSAAKGELKFDLVFAKRILNEVVKTEQKIDRIRKYVSYITLPLGFIPIIGTPIQKVAEELAVIPFKRSAKNKLSWYYMLSEIEK
jgi:hypothetical protein